MVKENMYRDLREICAHIDTTLFQSIADAHKTAIILMSDEEKEAKRTKDYKNQFICKLPLQVRIEILIYVFGEKQEQKLIGTISIISLWKMWTYTIIIYMKK